MEISGGRARWLAHLIVLAALALAAASRAEAATKIVLGYTATIGFNGAFIAKEQGFFAARGLDVDFMLIGLNSNIPPALVSESIQIGGTTPPVLLQANDGGLPLVILSNCAVIDPDNMKDGVLARPGSGIAPMDAKSFIGKKVGVPGLTAAWHVLFRKWLLENGVDYDKVNFVEVPFTQSADVLKSGGVDAVVTSEPFSTRVVRDNIGAMMVPIAVQGPGEAPSIFYSSTPGLGGGRIATRRRRSTRRSPRRSLFRPRTRKRRARAPRNTSNCRPISSRRSRFPRSSPR